MSSIRIVVVTQEEPFYLPPFLDRLAQARKNDIVGMVILRPFNESLLAVAGRLYKLYGPLAFGVQCLHFAQARALDGVNRWRPVSRPYSAADVARRYNIRVHKPASVNAPPFLEKLRKEIRPHLLVSVAASQVFGPEVLSIPSLGCINIHSAPLPRYQGMMPSFWALLHDEQKTAVTVHYMVDELDAGDIILQESVPIYDDDTLHSLIVRSKEIGVRTLLRAIEQVESGTVDAQPMTADEATYFSFPKREDARRFRAQGRRFR